MAIDPVCGMTVKQDTPHRHVHGGQIYLFCSAHCLAKFQAAPVSYLDKPAPPPPAAAKTTTYTCPMHPEVRQPTPGSCPKCGMALEPETPAMAAVEYTCPMHPEVVSDKPGSCPKCGMALEPRNATVEDNTELNDMTRRFWVSVALALPVFVLAMGSDLAAATHAGIALDAHAAMAGIRAGHAGGAVGRLAVLPARLGLGGQPQPQHVHA